MMRTPFTSLPLQTLFFFEPRSREIVQALLGQQSYDLVHVQLVRMAPIVDNLETIPKTIDLIDALSLNMSRRAQRERGSLAWITALEARRIKKYEQELTRQYDRLFISSPLDRNAIGHYDNICVIPNGVDIAAHPYAAGSGESDMIVFTGRMGYFPNADAAIWFTKEVFPLVRRQVPGAKFFIVGADPARSVRTLAQQPGVVVTGYVPRIQDYLTRSTVAVAPMRSGSGMRFKVLEAMASGTPLIVTPFALGGIEATDGAHLLIASDAETFADHVVQLLKNPALRHRLAHSARRLVEEKYTWERSVTVLESSLRQTVENRAG
jgi:sugar transferase (PEP-CTERM/EpsH1 system associated)